MARQKGYGQFCPVARASEILAERWVPLIVRELLCGSVRFNDIQRGVPRMSSALLSRRLKDLEYAGIVERRPSRSGRGSEYYLTAAGQELQPVVVAMGNWAQRWLRQDLLADENLDPDILMWDVRRRAIESDMEFEGRLVTQFEFSGVPANKRRYWLLLDRGEVDLCIRHPGFDPDIYVTGHIRTLAGIWLGHVSMERALGDDALRLDGAPGELRRFRKWFALSNFAGAGADMPPPPGA